MAESREVQAKKVFDTLCAALDREGWNYKKDEEEMGIACDVRGDDLPMELRIYVMADRGEVILTSRMPFKVPEDKAADMAIAVASANNGIRWGSFDYDIQDGSIFFRMAGIFLGSRLGAGFFPHMMGAACYIIDEYNDRFLMLTKGLLTIERFIALDQR